MADKSKSILDSMADMMSSGKPSKEEQQPQASVGAPPMPGAPMGDSCPHCGKSPSEPSDAKSKFAAGFSKALPRRF